MTEALRRASPEISSKRDSLTRTMLTKVPEATALFWVTKILTTGMGETAADYFGRSAFAVVIVAFAAIVLVGSLVAQFRSDRYVPAIYWLAAAMISVFGTMAADVWHVGLGISYLASTITWAAVLAVILAAWYRVEGTLSIHSITTTRREVFYWSAVLSTFALGTALGDLTAVTFHLGFAGSIALFAVLIVLPALAWKFLGLHPVTAFWASYVMTRPLGASIADWIDKPVRATGLGLGSGTALALFTLAVIVLVAYLTVRRPDVQAEDASSEFRNRDAVR